ncbi:dienelactone hydrolase family protein [Nocardia australiensis]|uniref:dienelactone hydrolase family protein n=1 Tax=Nocardia australiensis TaxID=2887191 RepID=UPI001D1588EB|nr:dienelactone hydrolase family protein [Nocardia australiensis]
MPLPVIFETLDLPASDGAADSYFARPDDGRAHPGLLLFMDAYGLRPVLRDIVETIAAQGFTVLAPNIFYRSGRAPLLPLPAPDNMNGHAEFFAAIGPARHALTGEKALQDAKSYLDWLSASEFVTSGALAVSGYCMGGRLALRTAGTFGDRVTVAASFHGGRLAEAEDPTSPHHAAEHVSAELFIAHADHDASMPPDKIGLLERALDDAGTKYTSVVYRNARHGFTMRDTPAYDEAAYQRHLRDLFALLERARWT